ncbi:hypothetical protein ACGFZH_13695 [Streptomyces zaomyceticus]|uniref:hypothetical protein n=1 Tax=Streptomyces zaomyceticus TaxID=68286 RepID=UPI003710BF6E
MTPHNEMRLLPWSGLDGKPCFLSTDDTNGRLSRLADETEAAQLELATKLLDYASGLLDDAQTAPESLRPLATDLMEALRDTLRVAESRGRRLLTADPETRPDSSEGPILPAAPFG